VTNRDFKFWLHAVYELGKQTHFYSYQLLIIKDHLRAVEDPDEFTHWLTGAIDTARATNSWTSKAFFIAVEERMEMYFDKQTPNRKEEIVEAVDFVLSEKGTGDIDHQKMLDMLRRERENMQLHHDLSPYICNSIMT